MRPTTTTPTTTLDDRNWLEQQFRRGRTYDDTAATFGCSTKAVGRAVRHRGETTVRHRVAGHVRSGFRGRPTECIASVQRVVDGPVTVSDRVSAWCNLGGKHRRTAFAVSSNRAISGFAEGSVCPVDGFVCSLPCYEASHRERT